MRTFPKVAGCISWPASRLYWTQHYKILFCICPDIPVCSGLYISVRSAISLDKPDTVCFFKQTQVESMCYISCFLHQHDWCKVLLTLLFSGFNYVVGVDSDQRQSHQTSRKETFTEGAPYAWNRMENGAFIRTEYRPQMEVWSESQKRALDAQSQQSNLYHTAPQHTSTTPHEWLSQGFCHQ